jgi:multidrug efflux pump subunit AcrB
MIKNLIKFGLDKSILNYMLWLFLFILSIFSYNSISKEIFPPSKLDAVTINGVYPGASSNLLDKLAVNKIEDELKSISEADEITSIVKTDFFTIFVKLKEGEDSSRVIDDIKDIVSKIKPDLPSDMDEPIVKEVVHSFPLVTVSLSDIKKSKEELLQIAEELKSKINALGDLSNINIWDDSDKQLLITFDEAKIDSYGLNKSLVINTISQMSSIFPAGIIKDKGTHYYLSSQNGQNDIKKLEDMIFNFGSIRLYLKDIARVEFKLGDSVTKSHFNGKSNISIGINKSKNGDAISLVKEIKKILEIEKQTYPSIEFGTYTDTSVWVKNRLNTVVSNIAFGIILLTIALFFFINFRIALVVALGIPTSFMIGLVAAEQLGYSLNMLSLLGALLALGMLVDEAIVVGENIYRHMEMGKDKASAAYDGAIEMFPAVLTATATTVFAFLPILLMTGEVGMFMKILPLMITVLLLSSLFEAFFFLPLHAKHLLKVNVQDDDKLGIWDFNNNLYDKILSFALKGKYFSLGILVVGIFATTGFFASQTKFQFFPDFDTTEVYVSGSIGVGNSIEETEKKVFEIEQKLLHNLEFGDEIDSISSIIGMKLDGKQMAVFEEFYFHIFINLKERAPANFFDIYINPILSPKYDDTDMTRFKSAREISQEIQVILKNETKNYDELKIYVPGAGVVKNDIEMSFSGKDEIKVMEAIETMKKKLASIDGVSNIADDVLKGNLDLKFTINQYGQQLGFNETILVNELKPFYFKSNYAKMYDNTGIMEIIFVSKNKDLKTSLDNFLVEVPNTNQKIHLKEIVSFYTKSSLSQIFKEDGIAIKSITASLDKQITSNEVYEKLQKTIDELSKSVTLDIKGEQKENKKVQNEMIKAFIIALILIFMALVWMFDSIVKSLIVLSTIPLSILGVLVGHFFMGINLTMPGMIGIVGLAGVIVNDGIIMMDFIKKSKNIEELKKYAKLRLRPILLTSLTTILGLSTLIFFASGQALILQPMAVSLGFGILWATILNLYYVPMLYRIIYLRKG